MSRASSGPAAPAHRAGSSADSVRQIVVAVSAVVAIVGGVVGSGAFGGTPIAEAAGGALAADATLVAPAGPAFGIWSVIYAGLIALAVFQALPGRRTDPRQRRTGWLVAASLVLNAAWILSVQAGWLNLSVVVLVALLVVLAAAFAGLLGGRPASLLEAVLVDGTVGLYLGWVSVATVAGTTSALVAAGVSGEGTAATVWAGTVLVLTGAVGVWLALADRGRLAPAASLAWGLAWIAVGRLSDEPGSIAVGITAGSAAFVVVIATVAVRLRSPDRPR